jgi:transcription termination/antitermination protein NusG
MVRGVIVQASQLALSCGSCYLPWFVVKTKWKMETEAAQRISDQGFGAFVPEHVVRVGTRKPKDETLPLFPGYVLASFDPDIPRWRAIVSTRGVEHIFGSSPYTPTPLPPGTAAELLQRPLTPTTPPVYNLTGATVQVASGPFKDLVGVCKWSSEKRVRVLLGLLNGGTVEVDRSNVRVV